MSDSEAVLKTTKYQSILGVMGFFNRLLGDGEMSQPKPVDSSLQFAICLIAAGIIPRGGVRVVSDDDEKAGEVCLWGIQEGTVALANG